MITERLRREMPGSTASNREFPDLENMTKAIASLHRCPDYHNHFVSPLFEHRPELADRRLDYILLRNNSLVKVINILLSTQKYGLDMKNCSNENYFRMARAMQASKEANDWELTPLSPLTLTMSSSYLKNSRWAEKNRTKTVSKFNLRNGVTEIRNRKFNGRIWFVARDQDGNSVMINHYLVFEHADYPMVQELIRYAYWTRGGHNLPVEPNRIVEVLNARSSFSLDPVLAQQRIYMTPEVKSNAHEDYHFFLKNEAWYSQNKIQYKRGYLFLGPPGNGKTTMIRAMAATPGIKAYMFDFQHKHNAENEDLVAAFKRVANNAPALFIMEDIDRLFERGEDRCNITKDALLNCLDGLITRDGVIVVATANHPELIDEAMLKRPGRFDRLVKFDSPDYSLRREMLSDYFTANPDNRIDEDTIDCLAKGSAGFSMASVKEIFITSAGIAFQERRHAMDASDAFEALRQIRAQYSSKEIAHSVGFGK